MRFLMVGIGGVYNYGCEALVRGTVEAFRSVNPYTDVVYASLSLEDDRHRLQGLDGSIIDRFWKEPLKDKVIRRGAAYIGKRWYCCKDRVGMAKKYDAVLSIGGDIYNLRPDGSYPGNLMKFGDILSHHDIPYIMWGASMGPFESNPRVKKKFLKHLRKVPMVIARESLTLDYLKSVSYSGKLHFGADPAFLVAPEITIQARESSARPRIGLNLSPLSLIGRKTMREGIADQSEGVKKLIKQTGAEIVLLPHVVCSFNREMDDLRYLRLLRDNLRQEGIEVELMEADPGFVGIKKEMINCDLVIAARMHCAINAVSACVPTLFLSYSPKATGMCEYIYGGRDNVFDLDQFGSPEFLARASECLGSGESIATYLNKRLPAIRDEVRAAAKNVMDFV